MNAEDADGIRVRAERKPERERPGETGAPVERWCREMSWSIRTRRLGGSELNLAPAAFAFSIVRARMCACVAFEGSPL